MIGLQLDSLPIDQVMMSFEGCEYCEQLELTRVPLLLILGGLSRKVRANPFLLPVLLVDVSSYASLAAVGAHVNGFLVIDVI
jgi:hypothetical protein